MSGTFSPVSGSQKPSVNKDQPFATSAAVPEERKGKFELKEGTISGLINAVLNPVEKLNPDLKGKLVLDDLEKELVDDMVGPFVEKYLRTAGVEASSVEIIAVLIIILAPRVLAIAEVMSKKKKETPPTQRPQPQKRDIFNQTGVTYP
jgi:hypothetical protein